jgi:hypothetical protein
MRVLESDEPPVTSPAACRLTQHYFEDSYIYIYIYIYVQFLLVILILSSCDNINFTFQRWLRDRLSVTFQAMKVQWTIVKSRNGLASLPQYTLTD